LNVVGQQGSEPYQFEPVRIVPKGAVLHHIQCHPPTVDDGRSRGLQPILRAGGSGSGISSTYGRR